MIRRPPRSTLSSSSAASDVYKRQPRGAAPGGIVQPAIDADGGRRAAAGVALGRRLRVRDGGEEAQGGEANHIRALTYRVKRVAFLALSRSRARAINRSSSSLKPI